MSTFTSSDYLHESSHDVHPLAGAFRLLSRWAGIRRGRRQLQELPDYMLADMGISRSQIGSATRYGRAGLEAADLRR